MTHKYVTARSSHNAGKTEATDERGCDVTRIACKILSCVRQLEQAFSIPIVISVLKGKKERMLFALELHRVAAYDSLVHYEENQIEDIIHALIDLEGLWLTTGRYQAVKLGVAAQAILRHEQAVLLHLPQTQTKKRFFT